MRRTVKEVKGQKFIIEEYGNFRELVLTLESREHNFDSDAIRNLSSWNGVSTYEEAEDLLLHGWDDEEKLNTINKRVRNLQKEQERKRVAFVADIQGFAPIVPNAIIGIPQSMINTTVKPKKSKVITIITDGGYSASTDINEILEYGAKLTSKIMNLEKQGYRVRLEYVDYYCERNGNTNHTLKVLLKSENQPFDIKRMMFPLAHPAMLRVISFEWYRKLPEAEHFWGYGIPLNKMDYDRRKFLQENTVDMSKSYFVSLGDNIDEVFKSIKVA